MLPPFVQHSGSIASGHYVCYARHHVSRQWYLFDDSNCYPVSIERVLAQEAYVLMYTRSQDPALESPRSVRGLWAAASSALTRSALFGTLLQSRALALAACASVARQGVVAVAATVKEALREAERGRARESVPAAAGSAGAAGAGAGGARFHSETEPRRTEQDEARSAFGPVEAESTPRSSGPGEGAQRPYDLLAAGEISRPVLAQLQRTQISYVQRGLADRADLLKRVRAGTLSEGEVPPPPTRPLGDDLDPPVRYVSAAWARRAMLSPVSCGPVDNRDLCCVHGVPDALPLSGSVRAIAVGKAAFDRLRLAVGGGPEVDGRHRRCDDCAFESAAARAYNRICDLWNVRTRGPQGIIPARWFYVRVMSCPTMRCTFRRVPRASLTGGFALLSHTILFGVLRIV